MRISAPDHERQYIDCQTPDLERKDVRNKFVSGEFQVVCNVDVLTLGVDWDVRTIVSARPTKSEMRYVQAIGRGLRPAEGKDYCLILDHSDTTLRLGFVSDILHEELDDGKIRERKPGDNIKLPKECPQCAYLRPAGTNKCPNCGFEAKPVSDVRVVDGELRELDGKNKRPIINRAEIYGMFKQICIERGRRLLLPLVWLQREAPCCMLSVAIGGQNGLVPIHRRERARPQGIRDPSPDTSPPPSGLLRAHCAQVGGRCGVVMLSLDQNELLLNLQHNGVMQRLADLARIPKTEEAREYFSRLIVRTLSGVWSDFELRTRYPAWKNPGPRDAASEELATRTLRWLRHDSGLSERDLEVLYWPSDVLGDSERIQPQAHRSGRRRGTVKNPAFQLFIRGLFLAAVRAGGRYTLEKNIQKGTVIEAIDILAPYLPDGFVPKNLPFSTLQRIKNTVSKLRNGNRSRTKN